MIIFITQKVKVYCGIIYIENKVWTNFIIHSKKLNVENFILIY